jgi:hypothetical protein
MENVLLAADGRPILADFGIAAHISSDEDMQGRCGTPGYAAPEVLIGNRFSPKCDVFGAGVVLYAALSGQLPFSGTDITEVVRNTVRSKVFFDLHRFDSVSNHMKDFVSKLLAKKPHRRPTAAKALEMTDMLRNGLPCDLFPSFRSTDGRKAASDSSWASSSTRFTDERGWNGCLGFDSTFEADDGHSEAHEKNTFSSTCSNTDESDTVFWQHFDQEEVDAVQRSMSFRNNRGTPLGTTRIPSERRRRLQPLAPVLPSTQDNSVPQERTSWRPFFKRPARASQSAQPGERCSFSSSFKVRSPFHEEHGSDAWQQEDRDRLPSAGDDAILLGSPEFGHVFEERKTFELEERLSFGPGRMANEAPYRRPFGTRKWSKDRCFTVSQGARKAQPSVASSWSTRVESAGSGASSASCASTSSTTTTVPRPRVTWRLPKARSHKIAPSEDVHWEQDFGANTNSQDEPRDSFQSLSDGLDPSEQELQERPSDASYGKASQVSSDSSKKPQRFRISRALHLLSSARSSRLGKTYVSEIVADAEQPEEDYTLP